MYNMSHFEHVMQYIRQTEEHVKLRCIWKLVLGPEIIDDWLV